VEHPLDILKQDKAGTLTPEALEAVATVHPDLYAHIQKQLLQKSAVKGQTLPYQSKMMISMILAQNVIPSLQPGSLQANQAMLQPQMSQQSLGASPKTSRGSHTLKNINVSGRAMLPMTQTILRNR
jgi:hypothetical protein